MKKWVGKEEKQINVQKRQRKDKEYEGLRYKRSHFLLSSRGRFTGLSVEKSRCKCKKTAVNRETCANIMFNEKRVSRCLRRHSGCQAVFGYVAQFFAS
jgi:hypothetical protein